MIWFRLAIAIALLGGATYLAWRIYAFYMTTTGSTMDRLAASFKNSATLFVQGVVAFFMFIGNGVLSLADFFQAPELRDFVNSHFGPEFATGLIVVILGLTTVARIRGMNAPPPSQRDKFDAPDDEPPR